METQDFISALRSVDSATVANAIERLELRGLTDGYADLRLRRLVAQPAPMVGFAVTMKIDSTTPGRTPDPSGFADLRRLLLAAPVPRVVVIEEAGPYPDRGCHMGDVVGTMLARNEVIGIVSGSGIRDLDGLRAVGISAFALGTVVSHGVWTITSVGDEVAVAGLRVSPGALLHGDGNGLVVIPDERQEELLRQIRSVQFREEERRRTAAAGWKGWETVPEEPVTAHYQ
jgi:4-hydroxy-4-methyl-2-oxoglutarate aldolase